MDCTKEPKTTKVEGIDEFYSSLHFLGSRNERKDLEAVLAHHSIRNMFAEECYRLLMEPVFSYRQKEQGVDVVVFRPLRDMDSADVYNWMLHFRCLDVDYDEFDDVAYVLDPAKHSCWAVYDSVIRGSRLFLTLDKERLFQEGCANEAPTALEYVTIPKSLLPGDVTRTGYTSARVRKEDLVIAWRFPEDPVRLWHQR